MRQKPSLKPGVSCLTTRVRAPYSLLCRLGSSFLVISKTRCSREELCSLGSLTISGASAACIGNLRSVGVNVSKELYTLSFEIRTETASTSCLNSELLVLTSAILPALCLYFAYILLIFCLYYTTLYYTTSWDKDQLPDPIYIHTPIHH